MSDPFVGEIKMFAGTFAPRGWAFCDGQLLAISQNDALFSLFGTIYGGDGRTSFGLPDCRGRVPVHPGSGPGLSTVRLGAKGGGESVTLFSQQIPVHNHGGALRAISKPATSADASGNMFAQSEGGSAYHTGVGRGQGQVQMHPGTLANSGGTQSHTNMAPAVCISFIVSLFGIYPSRS